MILVALASLSFSLAEGFLFVGSYKRKIIVPWQIIPELCEGFHPCRTNRDIKFMISKPAEQSWQ
jgi:hypothetical protein